MADDQDSPNSSKKMETKRRSEWTARDEWTVVRMRQAMEWLDPVLSRAEVKLGVKPGYMHKYFRGEAKPGRILFDRFETIGISSEWLRTGEGEEFLPNASKELQNAALERMMSDEAIRDLEGMMSKNSVPENGTEKEGEAMWETEFEWINPDEPPSAGLPEIVAAFARFYQKDSPNRVTNKDGQRPNVELLITKGISMEGAGIQPGSVCMVTLFEPPSVGGLVAIQQRGTNRWIVKKLTEQGIYSEFKDRKVVYPLGPSAIIRGDVMVITFNPNAPFKKP